MKILYIITQADGGGAQKYVFELAKYFGGSIAAGSETGDLFEAADDLRLTTYDLKHLKRGISPWHDFFAMWEIRQLIKSTKPDIIHLNSSKAGILGSFAAIGLKTKIIFTAHGFIFNEPLPHLLKTFYVALEKTASDYRDYIICVSEADRQSALARKLIAPGKISTVRNGIGEIDFLDRQTARTVLNLPQDKIIIGCLSNFYKTKGLDVFIEAVSLLDENLKNQVLVFLPGSGPEEKNSKFKIQNSKLDNLFKLPGKIDYGSRYLKAYDLFVLPSRKEGLPFALLEAMQAGLPIVAAKAGGIVEALGDAGILVDTENPGQLAQSLADLIENRQLQKQLSLKAIERSKIFSEQRMLSETAKIYSKIL